MIENTVSVRGTEVPRWARWSAYMMCAWAILFGALHFAWGAGWTPLIDKSEGVRPDALAWQLCIGILGVITALTGLALIQSRRQVFPGWIMQISGLIGGILTFTYVMWSYFINTPPYWLLAVGVLCVVGALVPLALIQPWGQYIPRWLMLVYTWMGGVLLTFHALYGIIVHGLAAAGIVTWAQVQQWAGAPVVPMSDESVRELIREGMLIWNPWFLLGGILYLAVAWYGSRHMPRNDTPRNTPFFY